MRGVVLVDGKPIEIRDPQHAQELGIALVAQELSLAPALSVLDNIWLGNREVPLFHRRKEFRERARGCAREGRPGRPAARDAGVAAQHRPAPARRAGADADPQRAGFHPGRADRDAVRRRDRAHLQRAARAEGRGQVDHLHHASARRGVRDLRQRHGAAQRRAGRHATHRRNRSRAPDGDDARPQHGRDVSALGEPSPAADAGGEKSARAAGRAEFQSHRRARHGDLSRRPGRLRRHRSAAGAGGPCRRRNRRCQRGGPGRCRFARWPRRRPPRCSSFPRIAPAKACSSGCASARTWSPRGSPSTADLACSRVGGLRAAAAKLAAAVGVDRARLRSHGRRAERRQPAEARLRPRASAATSRACC